MSDFDFDGTRIPYFDGASIGASLWAAGVREFRRTRGHDAPRALFCSVGACFDCLVDVDVAGGTRPVRSCRTPATPGLAVRHSGSMARPGEGAPSPALLPADPEPALDVEVAVIGAGPAGLAAAAVAHEAGADVLLIDAAPFPGGQIGRRSTLVARVLDKYSRDDAGPTGGRYPPRRYLPETRVVVAQGLSAGGFRLHLDTAGDLPAAARPDTPGTPRIVNARTVILCTGATEVVAPFPGWTTPGVLTAGGMQALLKGDGVRAGSRVLLAGTGPLLLPVAAALAAAGAAVVLTDESAPGARSAAAAAARALKHPAKVRLATGFAVTLGRHGAHVRFGWRLGEVRATPGDPAGPLRAHLVGPGGRRRVIAVDAVGVSHGLAPDVALAGQLGARLRPPAAGEWGRAVVVDGDGATDVAGLYAAGEPTGVGGGPAAAAEGTVAGLAAAARVGRAVSEDRLTAARRLVAHEQDWSRVLAGLWLLPAGWWPRLPDDQIVCRCEEVDAAAVRAAVAAGARTAREVKGRTRLGMGLCQGRVCGPLLGQILESERSPGMRRHDAWLDSRPLAEPVSLYRLASLD